MFKSKETIKASAVVVAAGESRRMGNGINKQFLMINEIPVLARTLINFNLAKTIDDIYVVTKPENIILIKDMISEYGISNIKAIVPGGATRQESVMCGLNLITDGGFVAIHDGARPFATPELIDRTVAAAFQYGGAAPGVVPKDTIKMVNDGAQVTNTPDRAMLRLIQTPQVFRADELKLGYIRANEAGFLATDDCSVMEQMGIDVFISEGEYTNIKVTTPEDIHIAEAICEFLDK